MMHGVLGNSMVTKYTHGALCRFIETREGPGVRRRRMLLMPRGTLKSTIATEGDCIRLAVSDPDNERILIANEVHDNAVTMQRNIRDQFQKNWMLRKLFGHLIPDRFTGPGVTWGDSGASLLRKSSWKEATWSPIGVGGAAVSRHFTTIKCDDLIGLEAYNSPAKAKAAAAWADQIEGLSIGGETHTVIDFIGTRWRKRDLYRHIMQRYGERMAVFTRSLEEEGPDGTKHILFPEFYTWEYIALLRKTPATYFAQYLNNPLSDEATDFDESQLRFYTIRGDGRIVCGSRAYSRSDLDIVLTVDPNSGSKTAPDEAAYTVSAVSFYNDIIVLENWGGRPGSTEFADKDIDAAIRWRVRAIGVERAGQQEHFVQNLERRMRERQAWRRLERLSHRNVEKSTRIRNALETPITEGRLWLPVGRYEVLKQQIIDFPDLENDDRIDSLSYGVELWRKPNSYEEHEANSRARTLLLRRRNKRTGY